MKINYLQNVCRVLSYSWFVCKILKLEGLSASELKIFKAFKLEYISPWKKWIFGCSRTKKIYWILSESFIADISWEFLGLSVFSKIYQRPLYETLLRKKIMHKTASIKKTFKKTLCKLDSN